MPDVLVVGGGPAAYSFAVTAARQDRSVTVMDERRRSKAWPGESLPAGGGELFESIFGPDIMNGHAQSFGTAAAWGSAELIDHPFMAHWSGRGWHLDREHLDATMCERAQAAGVRVIDEKVTSIDRVRGSWCVNGRWTSDWLVDASGRAGSVVARLGVGRVRIDDQLALVGVVADRGGERVTTVESTARGWWYSTPLPSGQRVVALVTDADLVVPERSSYWSESLATTMHMHALVESVDDVFMGAYPAGTQYRERLYGDGWAAIGDAAVSFDPLSSQGLITAVVMAAHAARIMGDDLQAWESDYRAVLHEHETLRAEIYASECRWPEYPFWARRRAVASRLPG